MPPCVIFEDDHLLVVNKPAGLNTHAPGPYAGEGLYDWLRHREPRWASLAIVHRLDKETSGVLVFSKSALANRSLTEQFTRRNVRKRYVFLTDREMSKAKLSVKSCLVRSGEKYVSRPIHAGGILAETDFHAGARISEGTLAGLYEVWAEPLTGKTHQIRVHAAQSGVPILGDTLYGGTAAKRVCLHAAQIEFEHPETGKVVTFRAAPGFEADPRCVLREALIEPDLTNAYRLINGATDGWHGWYVDRLGDYLLSQSERPLGGKETAELQRLLTDCRLTGAYHKLLTRQVRKTFGSDASPRLVLGEAAPEKFSVMENGLRFTLSFAEGYSVGLFLDQRDNRRRLLTGHVGAGFGLGPQRLRGLSVLNAFAYTCGFSVAAAKAGATTTSLDLSRKYLAWGRENFTLNGLDPTAHEFIYGDVLDWLRRLAKKERQFDVLLLDPPTFSQSKESGVFRVERDYGRLVSAALTLVRPGGLLFASTNAAKWEPEDFIRAVEQAVQASGRKVLQRLFFPQPPDFPASKAEPGYLKTVWLKVA